jgi:hypothetical protein
MSAPQKNNNTYGAIPISAVPTAWPVARAANAARATTPTGRIKKQRRLIYRSGVRHVIARKAR